MDPHRRQGLRQVRKLNVFAEQELIQSLQSGGHEVGRYIQQDHLAGFEDVDVREHPTLRCQPRRVAACPWRQRLDIVGQQAVQVRGPILAGEANGTSGRDGANGRVFLEGAVVLGNGH